MRNLCLILLALTTLRAQSTSGAWFVKNAPSRVGVNPQLRSEPPSSPLLARFSEVSRGRSITNGPTFYSRILLDKANRIYFGYELLIEQQQPGTYLAIFGKLGATAVDLAAGSIPDVNWTLRQLPSLPEPRVIHDGDTLSIDLFTDPSTGHKLIDDIHINPPRQPAPQARRIPTVSGQARDFAPADAELLFIDPLVTLNGKRQITAPIDRIRASLIWLYIPDRGRYVMSLVPRPDFKPVGEIRGGTISFTLHGDSIKLECPAPIAPGEAPYNLYVLEDKAWQPTLDRQKDRPSLGTVSQAELSAIH